MYGVSCYEPSSLKEDPDDYFIIKGVSLKDAVQICFDKNMSDSGNLKSYKVILI